MASGYDSKYGPCAQTPAQRAYVLRQMQATNPTLYKRASGYVQRLYARYVAGELSWPDVCALREAPMYLP
ncbi:hypothetical protein [Hymenobacter chitinivorans]|uniref:Uncharacterized protein n=1 Tax=Hymenobacter chitinivorans DSM 11115 TaxID=1121954 RepID=A0A2M9BSD0_9BACT|nr:hypothetical protein [Hymenobacter chitinivorans]PJJ60856.1 hypothetical protein CLV45_2290 [Hymenobacter chitinivorans DSM 11115]